MDSLPSYTGNSTPDLAERLRLAAVALDAEELREYLARLGAESAEEAAA